MKSLTSAVDKAAPSRLRRMTSCGSTISYP
jgi:hypothetical protein